MGESICRLESFGSNFSQQMELVSFFRKLALEEALLLFDELNSDSDLEDIYIEPPDAAVVSDEDSAEEDEGGLTDNLSGHQLRVNVKISRKKTRRKDYSDLDPEDEVSKTLLRNKKNQEDLYKEIKKKLGSR
ncbi:hypothetical protein AVEN_99612-1 [Araneus ventricosus]|uniref:Uncharacterized protein n=1 Tax=Araneus ventricosus TaxID=182803 RepID=A0A4Y2ETP3_ARAVE|nr:hypothetical protein AVEN_99612-1 [Araneus ventricosus]